MARCLTQNLQRSSHFPTARSIQQTRDRQQKGRFTRAGGPQNEDSLALPNVKVDAAQGPRPAAWVTPPETPSADRRGGRHDLDCSRPAASPSSTPVGSMARMSAQDPNPASTIPLTIIQAARATLNSAGESGK